MSRSYGHCGQTICFHYCAVNAAIIVHSLYRATPSNFTSVGLFLSSDWLSIKTPEQLKLKLSWGTVTLFAWPSQFWRLHHHNLFVSQWLLTVNSHNTCTVVTPGKKATQDHLGPVPSSRVKLTRRLTFDLTLG